MQTPRKSGMTVKKFNAIIWKNRRELMNRYGIGKSYRTNYQFTLNSTLSGGGVWAGEPDWPIQNVVDLMDEYYYIYDVKILEFGFVDTRTFREDALFGFERWKSPSENYLHKKTGPWSSLTLTVGTIRRLEPQIAIDGLLEGSPEVFLRHLVELRLEINGLKKNDVPGEFYKETMGEAFCLELDGRLKQSYFTYLTAVDSQTNFCLQDLYMYSELKDTRKLELADKFRLNIKRALNTNDVGKIPIVTQLTKLFASQVDARNDIAHSVKKREVTINMISEVVVVLLGVELVREFKTSDLDLIAANLGLS
jgi:hypothetical protein